MYALHRLSEDAVAAVRLVGLSLRPGPGPGPRSAGRPGGRRGAGASAFDAGAGRPDGGAGPGGLGRRLPAPAHGRDRRGRRAGEIAVKVEGWVSNSRVASHAVPRRSSLAIAHGPEFSAVGDVIAAADEAHRCREKLIVTVWGEDQCPCRPARRPAKARQGPESGRDRTSESAGAAEPGPAGPTAGLPLSLAPGGIVHVRLRLEHQHVLFGDYDPLLGVRAVEITLARGDGPRPSSRWTASNTWRSRGSPGPSRPRSAATPGTPSRVPTACTSRRTSPAITITDTPIGRSATARRCGCGSRT